MGFPVSTWFPRALARNATATTLASALLLSGCGTEAPSDASAPDETAAPTDDAPTDEATDGGAPTANLTDGCVEDVAEGTDLFPEKVSFEHASGVEVTYHDTYKVVEVAVPYAEQGTPPFTVVLLQCGADAPELTGDLADAQVVEVPTGEIISMTTVNLPHLVALDAVDHLAGVGTAAFVTTPEVVTAIEERELADHADADGVPDRERIVGASPDLLVLDAFGATLLDDVRAFAEAGVPTVLNADFDEATPLGRAEWVKYTALFLNREAAATEVFADIEAGYAETAALTEDVEDRPRVLLEQPFEGTWYVPAGGSFVPQLVADAGGDYVFADEPGSASVSVDLEAVLARGGDADVWIGAGTAGGTLEDLAAVDGRFREFRAFQQGAVWAVASTPAGGYPLYEEGAARPDLVLRDLTAILHPELVEGHEVRFYARLGEAG